MQQINAGIGRVLSNKTARFLKSSFLFALSYSTLLYVLIRVYFFEFPFTVTEGFELYSKILLVAWIFISSCKLAFTVVVIAEKNINKRIFDRIMHLPLLKKTFIIILTTTLVHQGKAQAEYHDKIGDFSNDSKDEKFKELLVDEY